MNRYLVMATVLVMTSVPAAIHSGLTQQGSLLKSGGVPSLIGSTDTHFLPTPGSETQLIEATNCYLNATYYGTFGETWNTDQGFYYNTTEMFNPDHYSYPFAFTESPAGPYGNYKDITAGMSQDLAISPSYSSATLSFYAHWDIEVDFDGMELEVSPNGGFNWYNLQATYTVMGCNPPSIGQPNPSHYYFEGNEGEYGDFVLVTANLNPYIGVSQLRIRFHFRTDGSNEHPYDGFILDDFKIVGDTTTLFFLDFDNGFQDVWEYQSPWGKTQSISRICNGLDFGQVLAGISNEYVAYGGYVGSYDDWYPLSSWTTDPYYCKFENTQEPPYGPHLETHEFIYGIDMSYDDYIIIDSYYHNVGVEHINEIYLGPQMDMRVAHTGNEEIWGPWYDIARYDSYQHLAYLYDYEEEDNICFGLALFTDNPYSVNFFVPSTASVFTDPNLLFPQLSNGHKDWESGPSPPPGNNWAVTMGVGPIDLSPNGVYRVCFAIIGGDSVDDLKNNTTRAYNSYIQLPDMSGFIVSIQPCSLGHLKAMFAE